VPAAIVTGLQRIARAFAQAKAEHRLAVVPYLTVGYPDRASTRGLLAAAVAGGADVIELGVPFSDPLADGTTVQRASEVALAHGVTLADCLAEAKAIVDGYDIPVVLMGYTNSLLRYGFARVADDARAAGVAGVIVVDLPVEEAGPLDAALVPAGIARIELLAPTTTEDRIARIAGAARGFVYCVSLTGVTGARTELPPDVGAFVGRVRAKAAVPAVLGFGISTPEHVASLRGVVDGVAVGSAVINVVTNAAPAARAEALRTYVASLVAAGRS